MPIVTRYLGNRETKSTKQVKQSDSNVLLLFYLLRNISMELILFLGPRGPLVLPSVGPSVRPSVRSSVRKKNLDHLYTGIYAL